MKSKRKILALVMAVVLVFSAMAVLTACGSHEASEPSTETKIFTDSAGRDVEVPVNIESVAPSGPLAQIVLYTACPDRLAGIAGDFTDDAKDIIDEKYWTLPVFGQFYGKNASLNMEALIEASPDVVIDIGEAKETVKEDMDALQDQLNIPVIFIEATLDTMDETYKMIGELIGETKNTDELAAYSRSVIDKAASIKAEITDEEKVTVYMAMGDSGLNTNAAGSFHADVIEKVGGCNVADVEIASAGAGSEVSFEQLLLWNPEVIIVDNEPLFEHIQKDLTWQSLDAVKNDKVYLIPSVPYSFMSNPPSVNRMIGIIWLGNILYPEKYNDDVSAEVENFYNLFYHVDMTDEQVEKYLN